MMRWFLLIFLIVLGIVTGGWFSYWLSLTYM